MLVSPSPMPVSFTVACRLLIDEVSFTDYVLWVVRMYAAAEMSMNSVERVAECEFRTNLSLSSCSLAFYRP